MKKLVILALGCVLLSACTSTLNQKEAVRNANEVAPYPAAEPGYARSVIFLPALKNEQNAKVELIVGKDMLVDCNVHRLSGTIKEEDLKGWGYQYYVVEKVTNGISTLMACPEGENKVEFVTINSNLGLLRYNSRLPIVVYAPDGIKVKYQIWKSENDMQSAVVER